MKKIKILFLILLVTTAACKKDELYKQDYYKVVNGKLTGNAECVGSKWIMWSDGVSEQQKEVFRTIINNMVLIDFGQWMQMGGIDSGVQNDELPVHQVLLSPYYICKYEVSQKEWSTVMNESFWTSEFGLGDDYPAYNISYDDAVRFINTLNEMSDFVFRLPTEAEWECAARSGNIANVYCGSNSCNNVAWMLSNSDNKSHPRGHKQANGKGLCDMSGNVWEWCSDWYGPYGSENENNPTGPETGQYRVLRGGSYLHEEQYARVANREAFPPDLKSITTGLRLVINYE